MGTVARLLDEHVSFRCTSVDRIGIRGYVPGLQYEGGVVKFLVQARQHRSRRRPRSTATTSGSSPSSTPLVAASGVPVVRFKRGESQRGHRPPLSGRGASPPGTAGWCWSARPRSGPRRGVASSMTATPGIAPTIPTSPGGASRRCPTTGTSISPTASGVRRSSSCARMRRIRCGAAPTATSGPNAS